nr:MAG TPA: hypothetical protein [Caudoviricetes sp.]
MHKDNDAPSKFPPIFEEFSAINYRFLENFLQFYADF